MAETIKDRELSAPATTTEHPADAEDQQRRAHWRRVIGIVLVVARFMFLRHAWG